MQFLYMDNGRGLFSSLMGSWLFWIVIIMVVVIILLLIISNNKNLQKTLKVEKFFGDSDSSSGGNTNNAAMMAAEREHLLGKANNAHMDSIRERVVNEINNENKLMAQMNNGSTPDLKKFLDEGLSDSLADTALPLGIPSDQDKNIKSFYHTSSKKENVFKVADTSLDVVNFKLELRDLSKITYNPLVVSEMRIYNQAKKCIAIFKLDNKRIKIKSISPFFDDIVLNIDDQVRLFAFHQVSNKLYVGTRHVATFDIYDKIRYFSIKSPIIKELQFSVEA